MKTVLKTAFSALLLFAVVVNTANTQSLPAYKNPNRPIEARVDDLVGRMTLEEKVSQMMNAAPAIERLGIPQYDWWNEALHGVARAGYATVFPQAIGLAATWDTNLMYQVADVISTEARAKHHEFARNNQRNRYQGLTFWSPNINIFRDPRWGRGQETYGEDPYLTARLAVEFVKGLQGNDPRYFKVIATPKHYAVHYTKFAYSNLRFSAQSVKAGEPIKVTVDVKNVGEREGDEVVQLYLTDVTASAPVPIRTLVGFDRISLRPGETRNITFAISPRQMSLIDDRGKRVIEPGEFLISIGGSQVGLNGKFVVSGARTDVAER